VLKLGDCRKVLPTLPEGVADCVVSDPPYELGFMGKEWDKRGVSFDLRTWSKVLRVLKPGGYAAIFGGTRTYHRLTCAVEDAGFEIRDCVMWLYGTGFPKGKGCLKPAWEPILLARKPGPKVLPLGIDECRIGYVSGSDKFGATPQGRCTAKRGALAGKVQHIGERSEFERPSLVGRWPANVVHDGGEEVLEAFAAFGERGGGFGIRGGGESGEWNPTDRTTKKGQTIRGGGEEVGFGDAGTAARFFYTAKASRAERGEGNTHPTVKPLSLMSWLVKLVCPPGGVVLDPFLGSGTTVVACIAEKRRYIGIEREEKYLDIARDRIAEAKSRPPRREGFSDAV
jgi:hypothetical protein